MSQQQEGERQPKGKPRAKRGHRRWPLVVVLCLLAVVAVCALLFCWQKWWRYDDSADIQGEWKVVATGDTIVLDTHELKLTQSISYEYRLDPEEKTLSFSFGQMEGEGRYYFSDDRQTLVIVEGGDTLGALAELGFLPEETLEGDTATDEVTVLQKISNDTSAQPSGKGNGLLPGTASRGERDFKVKPDPEPSSSSSSGRSSGTASSAGSSASSGASVDDAGNGSGSYEYGDDFGSSDDSDRYGYEDSLDASGDAYGYDIYSDGYSDEYDGEGVYDDGAYE